MNYQVSANDLPQLPSFLKVSLFLNRPILFVILFVFFVVYVVVSAVLMYHWSRYGMSEAGIIIGRILFLFVSAILFIFAALAAGLY